MKRELRGIKRSDIQLDFDLYRVNVPMPGVSGQELSVIDIRPPGVEHTILFVHGYAGSVETWEHQINTFGREYRVVAPDLRGHGQSDAPYTRYTMQELVADLYAITQYLNLPPTFTLVGHSFGGSICVEYASAHPEQIAHLVLIATAGEYPVPKLAAMAYRLPTAILRPVWDYRPRWNAELHVMKRMAVNNMLQWRGWGIMRSLHVPTLVITGERDTYFPRQVVEQVADTIPGAERVDVGASKHKIQLERHEAVNRAIARFIQTESAVISRRHQAAEAQAEQSRPWLKGYDKATPRTLPIPDRPVSDFLAGAADWFPKRTAILFDRRRLNYARLNQRANQFSQVLHGLGIRPGDRTMIFLPNMPELVIAYYGALRAGGVVVLPALNGDLGQVMAQARAAGVEVLVTLQELDDFAQTAVVEGGVRDVVTVPLPQRLSPEARQAMVRTIGLGDAGSAIPRRHSLRAMTELMQDAPPQSLDLPLGADDLAVIAYTDGERHPVRGVCLTHGNLAANTLQLRHWLHDLQYGKEVFLSVLPMLHSYGMLAAMNLPVAVGATMVMPTGFIIQEILDLIWRHQPTVFPGQPAMFATLSRVANLPGYGFASIRTCLSSGETLPVEVHEAFERVTRRRLLNSYGLTEASGITHAQPLAGPRKIGSVGLPLPNTEAKIVDPESGADLPPGQPGALWVRGPQVMAGYWRSTAPDDDLRQGWLNTGDLALMDSEGFFRVLGSPRTALLTPAGPVFSRDIEEVLYENNAVQEAAVVGRDNGAGLSEPVAWVVPRPGATLTAEELINFCRHRLGADAAPRSVEFCETLPRSATGKVLRSALNDKG